MKYDRLPYVLLGTGLLLAAIALTEMLVIGFSSAQFSIPVVANLISSLPFIALLVGGGHWLHRSDLRTDRYPRITAWIGAGFVFLILFFSVIAITTSDSLIEQIGILRWAAAVGAGGGMLVGIFEARAIDRAIAGEQTRIRNEELQRQNERLEEFSKILTHDLRNPLNVASGYLDLLEAEYGDEYFERIAVAHDRMDQIIDETLLLAKSGQVIAEPKAVGLTGLVDRCWNNVETGAGTVEIESTATIVADPDRTQHLFENLFRNAVEHGGPDVSVRVGTLPNGFYVEDDGPGIPDDKRETVFESGYSTSKGGTGFGLAIVRQIVEAHDWELRVTEGSTGGARFEITGVDTAPASEADASNAPVSAAS